ncbi:MAG TPA: 16S rRNA (cytosine(1402)-N(4))-methyltransferase RsmH [Verrucomicrobiae bacterium]|nr:16S rRNA (cytosine(1402)-N(4))-methyltransferase RsmH [Verrucomicrobiae bacterium]
MQPADRHKPVLLTETLEILQPERGGIFVDATLGMGGHSEAMLECAAEAKKEIRLIGIDRDPYALEFAEERLGERVQYFQGNYSELSFLRTKNIAPAVDGILMDIGVSSYQIDTPERGFSFQHDGPLDMRMDQDEQATAASILNSWPEHKLAEIFFTYGEERLSRKIAKAVVERRRKELFKRTTDLAEFVTELYHPSQRHKRPHPATRVFQALRIAVNKELEHLGEAIPDALSLLAPGGILAIITFHSLEDRIVKYAFKGAGEEFQILTKKPLVAGREEQVSNPRSRSAKLRAIKRLA